MSAVTTPMMGDGVEHTPGPWFIAEGGVCAVDCPEDGSNVICCEPETVMKASLAKWPDNARLIAAAPDMLTGLDWYADQLCEGWCEQSPDWAKFDDCAGCMARRIAAKARGEVA